MKIHRAEENKFGSIETKKINFIRYQNNAFDKRKRQPRAQLAWALTVAPNN